MWNIFGEDIEIEFSMGKNLLRGSLVSLPSLNEPIIRQYVHSNSQDLR